MSSSKTILTQTENASSTRDEFADLCSEAHQNARKDRVSLRTHLKKLKKLLSDNDPDRLILLTDAVTKTSEALSKANMQIIQIAQLKSKNSKKDDLVPGEIFSEQDKEGIYGTLDEKSEN